VSSTAQRCFTYLAASIWSSWQLILFDADSDDCAVTVQPRPTSSNPSRSACSMPIWSQECIWSLRFLW